MGWAATRLRVIVTDATVPASTVFGFWGGVRGAGGLYKASHVSLRDRWEKKKLAAGPPTELPEPDEGLFKPPWNKKRVQPCVCTV